jgi:flagellar hook-length control protein FliK
MNLSPLTAPTDTSSAAPAGTPVGSAVVTAFDNILALETMAAATPGLEVAVLEEGVIAEDSAADEGEDAEIEDLLGFLASLLNPASITRTPAGQTADAAVAAANSDDAGAEALAALPGGAAGKENATELAALKTQDVIQSVEDKTSATQAAGGLLDIQALDAASTDADSADVTRSDWATQGTRQAAAAEQHRIATPMRDPRWADDFSTRISLMVRGGESSASVQLTPVDLGPLDVNVTVRDSQATIHFGAAQAETRALIESSIPRLREMLEAQGFQLMDASVSQGFARQTRADAQATASQGSGDAEPEATVTRATSVAGLLDLYA